MPKEYDPYNWYWAVGGDTSKAFSSASGDYVQANDATFVAWQEDGTMPTNIPNEDELGEVLSPYNIRPAAANVLDGYKDHQARKLTLEVVAKVLFQLVNEVRALKGQQPVTANQFKNYVKGLM
jgi:hypothetical protein